MIEQTMVPMKDTARFLRNLADSIENQAGACTIKTEMHREEIKDGNGIVVDMRNLGLKYCSITFGG